MRFQDLGIKHGYDSVRDDLYSDFFSLVLSNSVECRRLGGNFTSKNFLKIIEGMKDFIEKDGKMQLVVQPNFSKKDIDAINSGLKKEEDVLLENWISDYDKIEEEFVRDHTKALAWMIKKEFLEIKIIRIRDLQGKTVRLSDLENISVLQQKIGIFKGKEDEEFITFRGNLDYDDDENEYSDIRVFKYWEDSAKKYCDKDWEEFERFWSGEEFEYIQNYKLKAISLPDALRDNLIKIAPESKSELKLDRPLLLRPIQREAISNWKKNNFQGIYEMATGTGKTRTAIGSIKELEKFEEKFVTIIGVPTDPLGVQWKEVLENWGYNTILTIGDSNWKTTMSDELRRLKNDKIENLCIVVSYITYVNEKFHEKLRESRIKKLFIADEVHNVGSPERQKGLIIDYDYRLGLTATLERYFDPEGTKITEDYFEKTVYTYTMHQAIEDGILSKYEYHMRSVDLTPTEYLEYREHSIIMARNYKKGIKQGGPVAYAIYKNAARNRADVSKNAVNKLEELEKILTTKFKPKMNYGLIYCNKGGQIDDVQKILNAHKPLHHYRKVTQKDTPEREQKNVVFDALKNGNCDVILAIKILDEGWDCPEVKNCVIMSSTGNEKEYVQRRGRVLRTFDGKYPDGSKKTKAIIYDLCVLPEIPNDTDEEDMVIMESTLLKNELKRMEIMAKSAINREDCEEFMNKLRERLLS